ncbi:MAG: lysine--tRNA ligase [Thermoprotei archaeon]|nr:MAG: lysine--tRNA ligase [Thermoprotei archaeon]RLF25930.1 MAG: lysine--tRNA ligase [Thermoprotei archaeon]
MSPAVHFVKQAVEHILRRFPSLEVYTCESGVTPSGKIHLGNFFDMCIADAIRRALKDEGFKARHILVIDSRDPFRRAPEFAPEDFKKEEEAYRGLPFELVPDPWGCHRNYVEHFVRPLLSSLKEYEIIAEVKYASEIHRDPTFVKLVLDIIRRREEARKVLNEVRRRAGHTRLYPEGWIPYRPLCKGCGRISEDVEVTELIDDHSIGYKCRVCGYEGVADVRRGEGKPPWRIDWPLRWILFNVNFEPLGKDHMASGSSYDTARALLRELYGREPPVSIFYDFVLLRTKEGKLEKFSKRKGIGLGVDEWLNYAPPEVLKFMILRRDVKDIEKEALPHWEFDPKQIPSYVEEFDKLEEAYFNLEAQPPRLRDRIKLTYELVMGSRIPLKRPSRLSYYTAIIISQRATSLEEGIEILRKMKILPADASSYEVEDAMRRLKMAKRWVDDFAPEYKFIVPEVPEEALTLLDEKDAEALKRLSDGLLKGVIDKNTLREAVWNIAIEVYGDKRLSKRVYRAAYIALSGKTSGPPLVKLIFELSNPDFAADRFRKISERVLKRLHLNRLREG